MRWSYKTVHYELRKEGLLGSAFLDESEVEESLNEFGRAGWELVSLMEVKDGMIAVFKQPLSLKQPRPSTAEEAAFSKSKKSQDAYIGENKGTVSEKTEQAAVVTRQKNSIVKDVSDDRSTVKKKEIGSIRIE